jgi:DNA polymerase III subunit chi
MSGALQVVEFHTGVEQVVAFTVRMLRKAYAQGSRVLVTAPSATLEQLSRQLWVAYEREFLAHAWAERCTATQRARSPIWLATAASGLPAQPRVVINVGAEPPPQPLTLERLIEVVSNDTRDAAAGRQRWRFYVAAGLQLEHHKSG